MRVAVVGAGLSGLVAAHELARSGGVRVTVYEKEEHLGGGDAKTVAADAGGTGPALVNLGFMAFNRVSCPNIVEWCEGLGVEVETSDMSFSASMRLGKGKGFEWGSRNGISGVLAQKSNLLSPRFWLVIHEIIKFKNHALRYLEDHGRNPDHNQTLGQFIQSYGYSQLFQDAYLIPMCACIWSSPSQRVLGFPALFVLSFFRDNHLLELFGRRPQWLTVKSGPGSYVNKVREELESMGCQMKTGCEVNSVSSFNEGYRILEANGSVEMYDRIIFSVPAHDALKVLGGEATHEELRILGAFQYIYSDLYLHYDESLMPHSSLAWSARNFLGKTSSGVCVTYWLNILQNTGSSEPLFVTLNPPRVPNHVLFKWHTSHPIPSMAAAKATFELNKIQGKRGIWFCGPYQGYGFNEDSVKAGKAAALGLLGRKCDLLANPKQMVPSWTQAIARLLVVRNFNGFISIGNLSIHEEGGTTFSFGKECEKCHVKSMMRVHDPRFYWKVATEADLGFAYSYINGYISFVDNKDGLLNALLIFIANRAERKRWSRSGKSSYIRKRWWTRLLGITGVAFAKYSLRHASRKNYVSKTRKNISEHYDLSNDFFALFMDPTMVYSTGIFKAEDESLEAAQLRKTNILIDKAKVEPEHHVLDIGCGWGTLAIQMVKRTGCKYTGITLSEEQLKYAKRKVKEAGLEDRITLLLCDYRQIPACHKFDRIMSIEMIEHVGHEFMDEFFGCCENHLAENGILVIQAISLPEERFEKVKDRPDFLREYIFPGGCLPSLAHIMSAMSNATRLCVQHVDNIGDHYFPTLMNWRDSFRANKEKALALGFDEKLFRTWEYYIDYSASFIKTHVVMDYQIVFARPSIPKWPTYMAIE